MVKQLLFVPLRMLIILTVLTGFIYPGIVTALATPFFSVQAAGSILDVDGVVVGSTLIGQANQAPGYFWPRPSAVNYMEGSNASALGSSGASNAGQTSATLAAQVAERSATFRSANGLAPDVALPPDVLFASGSGLDPHSSPQAAQLQVARVAAARGLEPAIVAALVDQYTEGPQLGFLGEPRVNVLLLNLALDRVE